MIEGTNWEKVKIVHYRFLLMMRRKISRFQFRVSDLSIIVTTIRTNLHFFFDGEGEHFRIYSIHTLPPPPPHTLTHTYAQTHTHTPTHKHTHTHL